MELNLEINDMENQVANKAVNNIIDFFCKDTLDNLTLKNSLINFINIFIYELSDRELSTEKQEEIRIKINDDFEYILTFDNHYFSITILRHSNKAFVGELITFSYDLFENTLLTITTEDLIDAYDNENPILKRKAVMNKMLKHLFYALIYNHFAKSLELEENELNAEINICMKEYLISEQINKIINLKESETYIRRKKNELNNTKIKEIKFPKIESGNFEYSRLSSCDFNYCENIPFRNSCLSYIDFENNIENIDFCSTSISFCNFKGEISNVEFNESNIMISRFDNINLFNVEFINSKIYALSEFTNATLNKVDFTNATLDRVDFTNATLDKVDFTNATLDRVDFTNATLDKVDFTNATLDKVDFTNATLDKVDFTNAKILPSFKNLIKAKNIKDIKISKDHLNNYYKKCLQKGLENEFFNFIDNCVYIDSKVEFKKYLLEAIFLKIKICYDRNRITSPVINSFNSLKLLLDDKEKPIKDVIEQRKNLSDDLDKVLKELQEIQSIELK